jgi:hypothetical protein
MTSLPGFTANAALVGAGGHYRGRARSGGPAGLVAQLRRSIGFCMADCDATESNPLSNAQCKFDCLDGGGDDGGGGPGGPVCKPSCGPCIRGTRVCVTTDCDTVERACFTRPPVRRGVLL